MEPVDTNLGEEPEIRRNQRYNDTGMINLYDASADNPALRRRVWSKQTALKAGKITYFSL
jgi:hypothetical protein